MFTEFIKEGLRLTHRNSQLVYIRAALTLINIVGFIVIVGVPALAVAGRIGMDISNVTGLFYTLLKDPFSILSKYLVLLLVIFAAFMIYLIFSSLLHLYVLGGTLGVLNNSTADTRYGFSFSSFFRESGKHFFPLMWLISITSIGFFFVLAMLLIFSIAGFGVMDTVIGAGTFIKDFISSFISISVIVFSIIISFASFVFVVYSMAVSVAEGSGAMNTIRKTYSFLRDNPSAFIFYIMLLIGIFIVNLLIFSLVPPGMVSGGRFLITLTAAFAGVVMQSYVMVLLWSCLIVFYVKATKKIIHQPSYDI